MQTFLTDDRQAREACPRPVIRADIRLVHSFPLSYELCTRPTQRRRIGVHWPPVQRCASSFSRAHSENWDRGCHGATFER